jgi:hypothetical protein
MAPTMDIVTGTSFLGAVLLIVSWFLKALKSRDCTLRDIAERCHALRQDATEAMKENSRILGQNSELLRENITLLRSINGVRRT